jgi:hypothetical protein
MMIEELTGRCVRLAGHIEGRLIARLGAWRTLVDDNLLRSAST